MKTNYLVKEGVDRNGSWRLRIARDVVVAVKSIVLPSKPRHRVALPTLDAVSDGIHHRTSIKYPAS
jgi:hypothetical protein